MASLFSLNSDILNLICSYLNPTEYCNLRLVCKRLSKISDESLFYQQALYGWYHHCSGMKFAIELNSSMLLKYTAKEEELSHFLAEIFTDKHISLIPTTLRIYLDKEGTCLDNISDLLGEDIVLGLFLAGYKDDFKFITNASIFLEYYKMLIGIYDLGKLALVQDFIATLGLEKLQDSIEQFFQNQMYSDLTRFTDISLYLLSLVEIKILTRNHLYLFIDHCKYGGNGLYFFINHCKYDDNKLLQLIENTYNKVTTDGRLDFNLALAQFLDHHGSAKLVLAVINARYNFLTKDYIVIHDLSFVYQTLIENNLLEKHSLSLSTVIDSGACQIFDLLLHDGYTLDQEQERQLLNSYDEDMFEIFHNHGYRFTISTDITNIPYYMFLLYKHNYPVTFNARDLHWLQVDYLDLFLARGYHLDESYEVDCNKFNEDGLDVFMKMAQLGVKITFICNADNLRNQIANYDHARFIRNCNKTGALAKIWGPRR